MLAESITKVGISTAQDDDFNCGVDYKVRAAASDALNFLRSREDFWEQVDVGRDQQEVVYTRRDKRGGKKPRKVLQSTRLNYIM